MANSDSPFGLRPVRYLNGSPWNGAVRTYYIGTGDSTALYIGDPVVSAVNTQSAEIMGYPPGSFPAVQIATAGDGNLILGVVTGILPVTRESTIYRAAATERLVLVADDPNLVFHVQDDGDGTPTAGWAGANANLASGSGSATTGLSGWELDASDTPAADASNQLLILGLANTPDNELDDFAVWEVVINKHERRPTETLGQAIA